MCCGIWQVVSSSGAAC
uniref:Uncharacterized protein n=1 Tax=Anguilla anguilla TaxID=7936 RepID=A0A0E9RNR9_ANGAN